MIQEAKKRTNRWCAIAGGLVIGISTTLSSCLPHQDIIVPCVKGPLAVFPTVYKSGGDSWLLCSHIRVHAGMEVLDVGTGTGIQALTALQQGAKRVVATDINPMAVANVRYNAARRGWTEKVDVRLVPAGDAGAYAVVHPDERFDLIVSNPPFFDGNAVNVAERAGIDAGHELVSSLFAGLRQHLAPRGKLLMVFWGPAGYEMLRELAAKWGLQLQIIDRGPLIDTSMAKWVYNEQHTSAETSEGISWMKRVAGDEIGKKGLQVIVIEAVPDPSLMKHMREGSS